MELGQSGVSLTPGPTGAVSPWLFFLHSHHEDPPNTKNHLYLTTPSSPAYPQTFQIGGQRLHYIHLAGQKVAQTSNCLGMSVMSVRECQCPQDSPSLSIFRKCFSTTTQTCPKWWTYLALT